LNTVQKTIDNFLDSGIIASIRVAFIRRAAIKDNTSIST